MLRSVLLSLTVAVALAAKAQHLRQGITAYLNDYQPGACGVVEWVGVSANKDDPPDNAVAGGRDQNLPIKSNTLYVCRAADSHGHMIPGKTFMPRSDSACNAADVHDDGESVLTRSYAEVLTVSPRAFSGRRLEWAPVAPGVNQHAPSGALATGNNEVGQLYSCRFSADAELHGDLIVGQTHFPRSDGYCCSAEFGGEVLHSARCEVLVTAHC